MPAMCTTREQIARAAAEALEAVPALPCLVGFDGFIDSIIDVVDVRTDMGPGGYRRISTIRAFAERCAAAAGRSANIERVVRDQRAGGNGPLMAGALAALGAEVTFIGAIGDDAGGVHPVFRAFAGRCREAVPIATPSATDCLEFDDGKLMFNETAAVQAVTWDRLVEAIGLEALTGYVGGARLVGIVNWSLLGGVPGIWRGLLREVFPRLSQRPRRVMIDLSDPAKRSDADLAGAMEQLAELNRDGAPVTLGLNLAEAARLARLLGAIDPPGLDSTPGQMQAAAAALREGLRLDAVVIHRQVGAAAADGRGAAWFDGPYTRTPRILTGAGDHFSAGFAAAQAWDLPLEQCLAIGCALSGAYVREGRAPTRGQLAAFLRALPRPEGAGV